MAKDKKMVPEIRFSGFTEEWEQRKFGDFATVQTCKRIFKEQTYAEGEIPFYKNGTLGKKPDAFISRELFEEFRSLYPFPEKGDVLMSVVGSIGRTKEYIGEDEYFQDSNIVWLKTDRNVVEKSFLRISYQITDWIIEGSTLKHLYNDNILRSKINLPSYEEQTKIGEFFVWLDKAITLHQRKCDQLQILKKSMLQKMFPPKGERVPRIRFPGFTDEWEQRKLGEILEDFSNKTKIENEYPVLSSTNCGMEVRDGRVSGSSNIGYKIIENDDLVLSPQNLWLGNININNIGKGIVSPSYKTYKVIGVDVKFLLPQLRMPKMMNAYLEASTQGASVVRRNLEVDKFENISLLVPSEEEQKKIGEYFFTLDNLITLHQRKCEQLKELKKSMLQKMFV